MSPRRPTPDPVGPGEESVWDYPRPPAVVRLSVPVRVEHAGREVAASRRAWKVMETAGAPTYYLPAEDVRTDWLERGEGRSWCEWKGRAAYWDLHVPGAPPVPAAAWSYPEPNPDFGMLRDALAFYAQKVDRCLVDGEVARPQPGGFYGGWVNSWIKGPVRGEPGSELW